MENKWINVNDELPITYKTGNWDGKLSDKVLVVIDLCPIPKIEVEESAVENSLDGIFDNLKQKGVKIGGLNEFGKMSIIISALIIAVTVWIITK